MAPSITETPTLSLRAKPVSALKTDSGFNKENSIGYAEVYKHDDEVQGTEKQPPASFPNYLPVWDNETERFDISPNLLPAF